MRPEDPAKDNMTEDFSNSTPKQSSRTSSIVAGSGNFHNTPDAQVPVTILPQSDSGLLEHLMPTPFAAGQPGPFPQPINTTIPRLTKKTEAHSLFTMQVETKSSKTRASCRPQSPLRVAKVALRTNIYCWTTLIYGQVCCEAQGTEKHRGSRLTGSISGRPCNPSSGYSALEANGANYRHAAAST